MSNPITPLITQLENPADLNLDELLIALRAAAESWTEYYVRAGFCERELQKELRAVIELTGPTQTCPDTDFVFSLKGEDLVRARRDAKRRFNDAYHITPVRRT